MTETISTPGLDVAISPAREGPAGAVRGADAMWPQRLRRTTRAALTHWGCTSLIDDAHLVVTELVTNALLHGDGEISVRIRFAECYLHVAVHDGSTACPVPRISTPDDESGRGLVLVDALADDWGVEAGGAWYRLSFTGKSL
ncbi:ATP-binding protein [Streptomyces sp. NPDC097981]|uniref:ATP-binding protein n=1 Tax=Streptomyces sp. NPDC097981 TaxID=3155428 RepID=UPI00331FC6CD